MNNSPLEFLAQKYGNVVKYDADGNVAGIFVKFPKCKSSDLVAGLPNHTHPAFIINGVEQDYILLGKYKAGENGVADGALLSLPNLMPARSLGADVCLSRMKLAGSGITGMTVADYGLIKLLAQREGWVPKGNDNWGHSFDDALVWKVNRQCFAGAKFAYEGYQYTCLITHTTAVELKPDIAPNYWKKEKQIGGTPKDTEINSTYQTGYRTLNGTGPLDWYLGKDAGNLADIIGSSMEEQYGYRIYNMELQIIENNNAADPNADLSASSQAWKAILPNPDDDGYTLVTPGTPGTLHWNWSGEGRDNIFLDTQWNGGTQWTEQNTWFKELSSGYDITGRLPYVPSIVKELGLFPTDSGDKTKGYVYMSFKTGELFPRRGGCALYTSSLSSGLGAINYESTRNNNSEYWGCRPRALM